MPITANPSNSRSRTSREDPEPIERRQSWRERCWIILTEFYLRPKIRDRWGLNIGRRGSGNDVCYFIRLGPFELALKGRY